MRPTDHLSSLSHDYLLSVLRYDKETGRFTWRVDRRKFKAGDSAGRERNDGYMDVPLCGRMYLLHRLAFFYVTGRWPEHEVDHKNLKKNDNRWSNLREATRRQNNANVRARGASGLKGVYRSAKMRTRPYQAIIRLKSGNKHLGFFETPELAHQAYAAAAATAHGAYAREA